MDKLQILLDLINFKLIVIIPHRRIILFLLTLLAFLRRIEEAIPIKIVIVLGEVLIEINLFLLR